MKTTDVEEIIKNYKPHKGFFDLSHKPDTLSKTEYAKILNLQNFIAEQNAQRDYLKQYMPQQWDKLKELSAQLQMIIFQHWRDTVFQ